MRTSFFEIGGVINTDLRPAAVGPYCTPNFSEWGTHLPMRPRQTHRIPPVRTSIQWNFHWIEVRTGQYVGGRHANFHCLPPHALTSAYLNSIYTSLCLIFIMLQFHGKCWSLFFCASIIAFCNWESYWFLKKAFVIPLADQAPTWEKLELKKDIIGFAIGSSQPKWI